MAATFPGAVPTFPTRVDSTPILPDHVNALQDEVTAIATSMITTPPAPVTVTPLVVSGADAALALDDPAGGAAKGRLTAESGGHLTLSNNESLAGPTWTADEPAATSSLVQLAISIGSLVMYFAPGGAAARAWQNQFMVAPTGAITQAGRPAALGEWTAYTPTWGASGTAPALGNGTIAGRYTIIGKTVHCRVTLGLGSTSTQGTGMWYFTVPPAYPILSWLGWDPLGHGRMVGPPGQRTCWVAAPGNPTYVHMTPENSNGVVGPGVPWTWAAGNYIYAAFTYETP